MKPFNKQANYKAIFSDIDGTLLNTNHKISPDTRLTIQKVMEQGVPFVLVSARMPKGMDYFRDELGKKQPMICYSGALVLDEEERPLYSAAIPESNVVAIYLMIKRICPDVSVNIYGENHWYIEHEEDLWAKQEMDITGIQAEVVNFAHQEIWKCVHKVLCMGNPDEINYLEKEIHEHFPEMNAYRSKDTYLEIMSKEASKSKAIDILGEYFGVTTEEMLSFGDGFNDIDMLKMTGTGVAMGNAFEEVKQAADYVTDTNDEEGLRKVLLEAFF